MLKQHKTAEDHALKMPAVLVSWRVCGIAVKWRKNSEQMPPEAYIQSAILFLMHGIKADVKNQ
jgi:hypothetical protein